MAQEMAFMDFSIRMIGFASTIFWILLVAFFASAVYSVKDLHINLGEPRLNLTTDGWAVVSIPLNIENMGYHSLSNFNLTTKIADLNGTKITEGSTFIPLVERGGKIAVFHNLTFNLNMLVEKGAYYLFNDSTLTVYAKIGVKLAEAIPVQASSNFSVPWGAPFYNFQLGQPTIEPVNFTHQRINVPISFENHAPIDISGEISLYIYNSEAVFVGLGESTIAASRGTLYTGSILLYVQSSEVTEKGVFEVYFSTQFMSYGPLVIPYDFGG